MDLNFFKQNLDKYAAFYNPNALFEKIKKVAKKAGVKTIFVVLILYYATFDKSLPIKDRLMVIAALGYFILPLDLLPDTLPLGFTADAAAMLFVVTHISNNISDDTLAQAKQKLSEWFGDVDET